MRTEPVVATFVLSLVFVPKLTRAELAVDRRADQVVFLPDQVLEFGDFGEQDRRVFGPDFGLEGAVGTDPGATSATDAVSVTGTGRRRNVGRLAVSCMMSRARLDRLRQRSVGGTSHNLKTTYTSA